MLDRFGKTIIVGYAEHEILWITAALSLPNPARGEAFKDIAEMTGRTTEQIRAKSWELRRKQIEAEWASSRVPMTAGGYQSPVRYGTAENIRKPSLASLMAGNGRRVKAQIVVE